MTNPFHSVGHPKLLVIGDLILDRYTWGNAERVSPEAPVLVLSADESEIRLGGGASVASLLRALEAEVVLAGVVGAEHDGRTLRRLLTEQSIDDELVLSDESRPTTTKQRFIGRAANRHSHQILRVDSELRSSLSADLERRLTDGILRRLAECEAVLISDYAKGVCSPAFLQNIIGACRRTSIPVLVDPARIAACTQLNGYSRYDSVSVLVPNRVEAELITGLSICSHQDAVDAAERLLAICQADTVVIKLDSEGMLLAARQGRREAFPTRACAVHDVTGAGDTVLAVLGLFQAAGRPLEDAIPVANAAAGIQVQRIGVAPITRTEVEAAISANAAGPTSKLVTHQEAAELADGYRRQGKRIVLTNGCFDLLHVGHVTHLQEAAHLGDVLFVAVNSDASVRRLKGPGRPVISVTERVHLLAALACVHHVLILDDDTPHTLLHRLKPDLLVKGGTTAHVVGREVIEAYGGCVRQTSRAGDVSTTSLLQSIHQPQPAAPAMEV